VACVPEYTFCRVRGDTFPFRLTLTANDLPIDITGSTFLFTVNSLSDPPDISTQIFQIAGVIVGAPANGVVEFTPTTLNADQVPADYYFDVQWTNATLAIRTILKGTWTVEQDITK
jgi:hypothetical protein